MKRFFQKLFAARPHPAARRSRSFRPGLESLGERLLPSITPLGPAFDVSGVPYANQHASADRTVARSANGNFAVTWTGDGATGYGIYTRLFNAGGVPLTAPMHLPGTNHAQDRDPTIAMSGNGLFAVAWTHRVSPTNDDVYVQRFAPNGMPLGGALGAATSKLDEVAPSIAMDGQGNLVVAYTSVNGGTPDVDAWYRRAGGATGTFVVANSVKNEGQASVALNDYGRGVVAYTYKYGASDADIYAQRIDALGFTVGAAIPVTSTPTGEWDASAAINDSGNFVVSFTQLTSSYQVLARRFNAGGGFLGQVSVGAFLDTRNEYYSSVSMDNAGHFIVAYTHELSPSHQEVRAQVFNSLGGTLGNIFVGSPTAAPDEFLPTVALGNDGHFIVAFETYGQKKSGGLLGDGVFAQRWHL